MRALHVSSGLDPRTGGTATAAVAVAMACRRAGIEVTLAYPVEPGTEPLLAPALQRLAAAGVALHGFPFWPRGGRRAVGWAIAPALDAFVRQAARSHDIVHTHSAWVGSSLGAVRAAKAAGRPLVLMPHESFTRFDMARGGNAGLRLAKRLLRRWYLARADALVLSSDLEKRDSLLADDPRTVAIPHPVIDETAPPPPPRPDRDGFTVGFLGRFHPKKNLDLLIKAVARTPQVRLVIGGGGDEAYSAELRALAEGRGAGARIEWRGFVAEADKPAFLRAVDLVAMPSQFECFGLVAAEALGEGTPVLVSPTVGLADMIADRNCGTVVPPRADALGAALARLADGMKLTEWRANARATAVELFSYRAHGAALAALYERLAIKSRT